MAMAMKGFDKKVTAFEAATKIMHSPEDKLGHKSLYDYATTVGGVYIFTSKRLAANEVESEAYRFITEGQRRKDDKQRHNAILMWNPKKTKFRQNICPYNQRYSHGLRRITKEECHKLGIQHILLLSEKFAMIKTCLHIEKECQQIINHLRLGTQRLHRTPGASGVTKEEKNLPGHMTLGATVLPPDFFQNHDDIVIVEGAYRQSETYVE